MDVVSFLPAGDPWQKSDDRRVSPAAIRCEMVAAAIDGFPHFELDRREADRNGPTYTWDTIQSFAGNDVFLVLGADAAATIRTWHRGDELAETVDIAVVERPGTRREDVERAVPGVRWLEMPALDISSSELRRWRARGFSARFLIPDPVLAVVERHGLFSDEPQL